MEVAGVVLGLYPATILAFEQYKKGAKYFKDWAQFRRKYEAFIRDMEGQQLFFEGILQDLMCGGPDPFITGTASKDSFLQIVSDATYSGWRDPRLKMKLRSRLDVRYEWCIHTIQRIYDIMEEIGILLDIQALGASDRSPDWWRYQWKRIVQTLFVERYEEHKEAKRLIDELKQMVDLSDREHSQSTFSAGLSLAPVFQKIRQNANGLHGVLQIGWNRCYSASHKALIQLERRIETRDMKFDLQFEHDISEYEVDGLSHINRTSKQRVRVTLLEKDAHDELRLSRYKTSRTASRPDVVSQDSSPVTTSQPESTSSLAYTSDGSQDNFSVGTTTTRSRFQDRLSALRLAFRTKRRGKKPDNMISYKKEVDVQKSLRRFNVADSMRNKEPLDQEPVSSINCPPKGTTYNESSDLQHPLIPSSEGEPNRISTESIPDLCQAIKSQPNSISLGHFIDGNQNRLEFLTLSRSVPGPKPDITTLSQILEDNITNPFRFPPEKRAIVATILASSLLQLQRTQWLKDTWSKSDVFFMTQDGKIIFDEPFLSKEFVTSPSISVAAPAETAQHTVSASNSLSDQHLPHFRPKTSLECLGIVLIELCFGVPIERWQEKVRLRPMEDPLGGSNAQNHEFCLAIAHAWTWEEIRAQDPLFSDPINSCLYFPGLGRIQQGKGDEVIQDMYALIAKPLYDETMRRWPPTVEHSVTCYENLSIKRHPSPKGKGSTIIIGEQFLPKPYKRRMKM